MTTPANKELEQRAAALRVCQRVTRQIDELIGERADALRAAFPVGTKLRLNVKHSPLTQDRIDCEVVRSGFDGIRVKQAGDAMSRLVPEPWALWRELEFLS